jgi:hypothetical protein
MCQEGDDAEGEDEDGDVDESVPAGSEERPTKRQKLTHSAEQNGAEKK